MSLVPLLAEGIAIRWHAFAAFAALLVGAVQLAAPKGTLPHRTIGYLWAGLMLFVAVSSLWIHELRLLGPWSPIHLLSIVTIAFVPLVVWYARRRRIGQHRRGMIILYVLALLVTGLFTLLPGRVMNGRRVCELMRVTISTLPSAP